MAKVKIELPETFLDISIKIPVRISDINYGNHVGNDSIVSIVHEARVQFLQHFGFTELNINGAGLIMNSLAVEFKNESFYGDVIDIKIAADITSKVSFELFYKLTTERNDKEIRVANAQTGMVCYNYQLRKVAAIPEELLNILAH